jgi:hypothetical protein
MPRRFRNLLFGLILCTGFGRIASERIRLARAGKLTAWSVASAAYLFALPLWLPPLLVDLEGADLLIRAGVCVLVLTPADLLMGFGFRPACDWSARSARLPRRGSGASTELHCPAASLAVATSVAVSIDATLRVGAACYLLVAAPAVLLASVRSRPSFPATIPAP